MSGRRTKTAIVGAMVCSMAGTAMAGTQSQSDSQDVQAQLAALKAQVAQLQQQQGENWLNQRRKQEVKSLVRDVLKDADSRTSLLDEGMTAGYDGQHFFLGSADGDFKLGVEGQLDFRYIYNNARGNDNRNVQGFQTRRAKLGFFGNIYGKQLTYKIKGAFNDGGTGSSGSFQLEDAWIDYNFGNGWDVKAGQFTNPFEREFMVSSSQQQAVERSLVTQYFDGRYTKGVSATYKTDKWRAIASFIGGSGQSNTDFNANNYEYGIEGRGEYVLAGNWKEWNDFAAWSDDPAGVLLGAAVQYDAGAQGVASKGDLLKYTADVSAKFGNGMSAYGAFVGQHVNSNGDAGVITPSSDQFGFIAQGAAFVVPDKMDVFARYEYANLKGAWVINSSNSTSFINNSVLSMLTVGSNYYLHGQNAKLTLDGIYSFKPVSSAFSSSGSGIVPDMKKGEFALRAQVQLLF